MIEQYFLDLGFSHSEINAYLALAQVGKASATSLAKRCNLPRSTAYSLLGSLVARGVVSIEYDQKLAYYVPNPPTALSRMVNAERQELLQKLERKTTAARELEALAPQFFRQENYSIPRIQMFEGRNNIETMLYNHEKEWKTQISLLDYTWWGYQDVHFVQNYRKWLDQYWSAMGPSEKIWLFSNQSETEKKLQGKISRRHIKELPEGTEFSSTIWVLGEYVVMIMTRQQPHYAFQMKDAVFAANQR